MSLKEAVTKKVTQELLTKIMTLLSSVSAPLSAEDIRTLVSSSLESYGVVLYASNNDIGLCVDRICEVCSLASIDDAGLESHYATLRSEDPLTTELMDMMADGIARQLTTPLHDLRQTIPQEVATLTSSILKKVPSREVLEQPTLRHFSWGKLGLESYRTKAMLFAKDRTTCFKKNVPQAHDTDNILKIIPSGVAKRVNGDVKIREGLITALTATVTEKAGSDDVRERLLKSVKTAADLILFPTAYVKWTSGARENLSGTKISSAVIETTDAIDDVEDILQTVTTSMLTKIGEEASLSAGNIIENLDAVLSDIQLLRAAMVYHKERSLADRVLLTPGVVQKQALESFILQGGTESMVSDYVSYLRLNDHITIAPNGVGSDTIKSINERAKRTVQSMSAKLRDMAEASHAVALQDSLSYNLDILNLKMIREGLHNADRRMNDHKESRVKALVSLGKKPLEDIALEYLVSMRESPLTKSLYTSINTELHRLVKTNQEVTKVDVARATCSAVTSFVLRKLSERFAMKAAA